MTYEELRATSSSLFQANEGNPDVSSALGVGTAMMLGLYAQAKTGKGQYMETTMLNSCLYAEADDFIQYDGKPDRLLPDAQLNGLHALYRFFRTADDWVFLAAPSEREWADLCEAIARQDLTRDPGFATHADRLRHDADLAGELEGVFLQKTSEQWELFLAEHRVACSQVFHGPFAEWMSTEEALKETGLWVQTNHPSVDDYYRHGEAVSFSECDNRLGPTIFVGEHTTELLREAGYSEDEIGGFMERNVVVETARDMDTGV